MELLCSIESIVSYPCFMLADVDVNMNSGCVLATQEDVNKQHLNLAYLKSS